MKANTSITMLAFMSLVGIGTFLGMFTFMYELGEAGYDISPPVSSEGNATLIMDDLESTGTDLKNSLTGSTSWTQTAFNIFFNTPNNILTTLSTIANSASRMISLGEGNESHLPIPSWLVTVIEIVIVLIIISTLVYLALGRRA